MRKKLIEVALPLEAINVASAREKSIRHGHPSTLHLWWARRPLAAARAVIFTSLVDDPDNPEAPAVFVQACRELPKGKNATLNDTPRMRLFDFIELLVQWESTTDEDVINTARRLILKSTDNNPPPLLDPFAGGGSIPLEAQRLGLEAHASDLNPVAVMINKAQIEIPPRFANCPPVNPRDCAKMNSAEGWKGAAGLAADVRYYGEWMRDEAFKRIGHLYPPLSPLQPGGTKGGPETVIAWLWARTVMCPNPACGCQMPLVRSFELSKKDKRRAWVEPVTSQKDKSVSFRVKTGDGKPPEGTVNRRGARCVRCGTPVPFDYVRAEGKAGRMGAQMMAIVTEGHGGRSYYAPDPEHNKVAREAHPGWKPEYPLPKNPRDFKTPNYGINTFGDLFTPRQLVALTTFSDLVAEAREQCYRDAQAMLKSSQALDTREDWGSDTPLRDAGAGARAYAEAVSVYLAFILDKLTDLASSLCRWEPVAQCPRGVFGRQAIPMIWDFSEGNPLGESSGSWHTLLNNFVDSFVKTFASPITIRGGTVEQRDATSRNTQEHISISTDPPYYDNIGYADLSDYFYVWLRMSLRGVYPELFSTVLVPKKAELVATPARFDGDSEAANKFFESGLRLAFIAMLKIVASQYPLTVYYAYKQTEGDNIDEEDPEDIGGASIGWETMLMGLTTSGFLINGTWPLRTETKHRLVAAGTNALASSIVLVCRPRPDNAPTITRRQFVDMLRRELPAALKELQSGNIAPVDLAQASIGPGMAVYSRYSKVLEADGSALTVRAALGLINQELDAYLAEQDGAIDPDTRFAVTWFQQYGFDEGEFGVADVLARAKGTSVDGVARSGVVRSGRGKVQLVYWGDYDAGAWDPRVDRRLTVWEATHHLIERLNHGGEERVGELLAKMSDHTAAEARNLAYRLYNICERKGWAEHARDYNALVVQWAGAQELAKTAPGRLEQGGLFG